MRTHTVAAGLVAGVVCAAACGGPVSGGSSVHRLSIATGGTGGVFYPYGGGIAKVLTEKIPGVEATAEVTAASVDNLKFLKQGTSDIAFTMADMAKDGLGGQDAFKDFGPVPVRALAVLYPSYTHLVVRGDSGITSVAGLKGKVVSTGPPGAGSAILADRILATAGLDAARDLRPHNLSVSQAVDAMKDGKLDAFFWSGGVPTAAVLDLLHSPGLTANILPLDGVLPELQRRYGKDMYYRALIPKAVYKLSQDVPVVAVAVVLVVSESMPETLAHDITKVLFDEQPALAAIHPQASELALSMATKGAAVPFHPGAERFYRERGAWTP
jgi:TRAP transporter TAXI family solute receptor